MKRTYTLLGIILVVLGIALAAYKLYPVKSNVTTAPLGAVAYTCDAGKSFTATFSDASVALTLSHGRTLTLPQVMSGSGIRYELGAIALVGKGSDAFIEENGTQTFANCIVNASGAMATTTTTTKTFTDNGNTFSFAYSPDLNASGAGIGYTQEWMSNATTTGLVLAKLTLPKSFQPNTNFSEAKLTVGTSADPSAIASCLTDTTGTSVNKSTVIINGTTFTKFVGSDAGAGNLYQTTSYHTTNIGNYSPDQGIKEYDSAKVNAVLDSVVQSFRFL
jgi:membrane-bound inhibitor of C-type lysozyme